MRESMTAHSLSSRATTVPGQCSGHMVAQQLRGEKGTCWEGRYRVPGIFHWPGKIKNPALENSGSTALQPHDCLQRQGRTIVLNCSEFQRQQTIGDNCSTLAVGRTEVQVTTENKTPSLVDWIQLSPGRIVQVAGIRYPYRWCPRTIM